MGQLLNVVVLGGSAGALPTMLNQADRLMVPDHSCLFVIYHRAGQHDFDFQAFLPAASPYRARSARTGMPVEPNSLYHPHKSEDLVVERGTLLVLPPGTPRPNLDRLFTSLAREYGDRVVGVLLSGVGTDGVDGLRAIQQAGGRTLAQDPEEAAFGTLPQAAVEAGVVDHVLPTASLVEAVERLLAGQPAEKAPRR